MNNLDVNEQLAQMALLLDDRAQDFFDAAGSEIWGDIKLLKQALVDHFDPKDLKIVGWSELHNRRQKISEDLARYYEDICTKAKDLGVSLDQTLLAFVNGLPLGTKRYVSLQAPESISIAYELARQFQAVDQLSDLNPLTEVYKQTKRDVDISPKDVALAHTVREREIWI